MSLLGAHFKMSLSRAQNIFLPANINSIVLFFPRASRSCSVQMIVRRLHAHLTERTNISTEHNRLPKREADQLAYLQAWARSWTRVFRETTFNSVYWDLNPFRISGPTRQSHIASSKTSSGTLMALTDWTLVGFFHSGGWFRP